MTETYERDAPLSYVGPRTFFRAPYLDFAALHADIVAVVGAPWDTTGGGRAGARFGPQAIRESSLFLHSVAMSSSKEWVNIDSGKVVSNKLTNRLVDLGDLNLYPTDTVKTLHSIEHGIYAIVTAGAFPVLLGGDHFITYPAFLGFAKAIRQKLDLRIGYLHIDSHFDVILDNPIFGHHFYGATVRLAMESGLAKPENFVWFGVNGSLRKDQYDYVMDSGGTFFSLKQIRSMDIRQATELAVERALHKADLLYVSIDIDVVQSHMAPGTGAISFDGLTAAELLEVVDVLQHAPVGAIDLVEVCPQWDPAGTTERLAASVLLRFLSPRIFV